VVVVREVPSEGAPGRGGDVLQGRRIGGGGRNDDRLVEDAMLEQRLPDGGNRRGLLADGDVDADHVGLALVDDGIDRNGRLARLAVADDELALASSDRHHGVNGHETRLDRLADRLACHDARGLELDRTTMRGIDGPKAVDWLTQRVDDAAEHGVARRYVHDMTGGTALVTFLDGIRVPKEDGPYRLLVQVLGKAVYAATGGGARELQQLAGHGRTKAGHAGDAVADLADLGGLLLVDRCPDGAELVEQGVHDPLRADFRLLGAFGGICHCSSLPMKVDESVFLMFESWARTDAS